MYRIKSYILVLCMAVIALLTTAFVQADNASYVFFSPQMAASHLNGYTEGDLELIQKDLAVVRSVCMDSDAQQAQIKPVYLATAGAPGSRKTTILERFLRRHHLLNSFAYLDPDQRGLKLMPHTYYSQSLCAFELGAHDSYSAAMKDAYEKWRGASNYITVTLLEEALAEKRNIAHGSTSTGSHIGDLLPAVHDAGYDIVLLLCSAEDDFREKSITYRIEEQKFYQTSPEDAIAKGKLFPERLPIYFSHADTLYLFWNEDLFAPEKVAAIFTGGTIKVLDEKALQSFQNKFERDRAALSQEGIDIPSWSAVLDLYFSRYTSNPV